MFGRNKHELDKPPVSNDRGAVEILRVWGGEGLPQQYSLRTTWDDPGAWGLLLADVARHAARAFSETGAMSEKDALLRIKSLLDAEWSAATDSPTRIG